MRQLFFLCLIRRDAVETIHRHAASSEVPVLQAVYGDNLVVGESHVAERDELSPADEFERLAKRYGQEAVIAAYGTRHAAEREIAKLFADPAAQLAPGTGAKADTNDAFLAQGADAVIAAVPDLADDELAAYLEAEQAAKKPRKTVVAAIEAELQKRAEEDAADAARNAGGTAQ